jgi:hypothetical protein
MLIVSVKDVVLDLPFVIYYLIREKINSNNMNSMICVQFAQYFVEIHISTLLAKHLSLSHVS